MTATLAPPVRAALPTIGEEIAVGEAMKPDEAAVAVAETKVDAAEGITHCEVAMYVEAGGGGGTERLVTKADV